MVTNKKYGTKRLNECYKIIANCVNIQCSLFNESPSPYITTLDKPLTIDPESIEISEKFKALSSIRKLFIKSFRILLSALNFSEISIDSGSIVNGLSNVVMYGDGLSLKSEH